MAESRCLRRRSDSNVLPAAGSKRDRTNRSGQDHLLNLSGAPGMFAVRPEKIHMAGAGASVAEGMYSAEGVVEEVVYLGMFTRYRVALDTGGEMIVAQQNLEATSMAVHNRRGERVRLLWQKEHTHAIRQEQAQ